MMPVLEVVHENNNNGVSYLKNIEDVAKVLKTPPEFLFHWFSLSFHQSKLHDYRLKGSFSVKELTDSLMEFIKMFIWCPSCGDPETSMSMKKNLKIRCKTCGHSGKVNVKGKEADKMLNYIEKEILRMKIEKKDSTKKKKKEKKVSKEKKDNKVKKTTSNPTIMGGTQMFLPSQMNSFDF